MKHLKKYNEGFVEHRIAIEYLNDIFQELVDNNYLVNITTANGLAYSDNPKDVHKDYIRCIIVSNHIEEIKGRKRRKKFDIKDIKDYVLSAKDYMESSSFVLCRSRISLLSGEHAIEVPGGRGSIDIPYKGVFNWENCKEEVIGKNGVIEKVNEYDLSKIDMVELYFIKKSV